MPIGSDRENSIAHKRGDSPAHPLKEPIVLTSGNISLKIYASWNTSQRKDSKTGQTAKVKIPSYSFNYYIGSERKKITRSSLAKAKEEAKSMLTKLRSGEAKTLELKGYERRIYLHADQLLKQWNPDVPLDSAILDYTNAMKRVGERDISLADIVKDFANRNQSTFESRMLPDVIEEFIAAKTKRGCSEAYVSTLCRLRNFGDMFSIPIKGLTKEMITHFVESRGQARTQFNYLGSISTLIRYAVKNRYAPPHLLDEVTSLEKPSLKAGKVEVFTPVELEEMLTSSRPKLIPWIAIAAFAGLRTSEIMRLDWSNVYLERKTVDIPAEKAKTQSRRSVPLCDAAILWLRPHAKDKGRVTPYAQENKVIAAIKSDLKAFRKNKGGKFSWKRNGFRHGFCSYRLAILKDLQKVAYEAGNSPQMIQRHYHELVPQEEAARWFSVSPPQSQNNVISLPCEFRG